MATQKEPSRETKRSASHRFRFAILSVSCIVGLIGLIGFDGERTAFAQTVPSNSQAVTLEEATLVGDETIATPYGDITLTDNFLANENSEVLYDAMDTQRASQAYIWSTPMVSMLSWRNNENAAYGSAQGNTFSVLTSMVEKRGVVTGNLTTPYIFHWPDLTNGPIEVQYPAGLSAGGFLDLWQRPIADVGMMGPDKGKGATFIMVGPDDDVEKYKADGKIVVQTKTRKIFLGIRLLDDDPAFGERFRSELKMGPVGGPLQPCEFNAGKNVQWSGTAGRGLEYWKTLHEAISTEPLVEADLIMHSMLKPLGIERGKPFAPNDRQKKVLLRGAALGELMARNLQTNPRFAEPYWPGTQWYKCFDFHTTQRDANGVLEIDERANWFYEAVTATNAMVNPVVGKGQVYMTTKRDSDGNPFRADQVYRLRVPKDVPVSRFWALTLYSEQTRRPYNNGSTELRSANLDSHTEGMKFNDDGSVDLYIGRQAPAGMESNFMKTVGDDGWFVYFRLYGPEKPWFDKSFTLPDFERVK